MLFKTLKLAGAALIGAAVLMPAAAGAQYHGGPASYYEAAYGRDGPPRGRNGYARDGYAPDSYGYDRRDYARERHQYDRRAYRRCDKGTGGTILGAIAGGLLGNAAVGRRGNNTAGILAGAGVGALAGNAIDRDC